MEAAQTGRPQAVRLLLENGADPNIRTKKNESALAYAATAGNEETVKMLLDRGAESTYRTSAATRPCCMPPDRTACPPAVVKMLLAKGADLTAKGDGETAAMLAAKRGDSEVARLLGVRRKSEEAWPPGQRHAVRGRGTKSIPAAVEPAFTLLEKQSHNFIRIGGCNSCHAQDLASAAAGSRSGSRTPGA
jgi:hypothetical protein